MDIQTFRQTSFKRILELGWIKDSKENIDLVVNDPIKFNYFVSRVKYHCKELDVFELMKNTKAYEFPLRFGEKNIHLRTSYLLAWQDTKEKFNCKKEETNNEN